MTNVIEVQNLSKQFKIDGPVKKFFLSRFTNVISGVGHKRKLLPLRDINFEVGIGEKLGFIGRNGAGKSTLLKLISGIYQTKTGKIIVNGSLIYLSNLSNGLKQRLSVKDNIFLVGGIFGLSTKEIKKLYNRIVEFSDLEKFVDSKFYQLSSGMQQRISFSITMHCLEFLNPDIMLLDEVLPEFGDEEFKNKSNKKIQELISGGKTVIIVSHNLNTIQKFCSRVLWLNGGQLMKQGNPKEIIDEYLKFIEE
ncbi:ABC transporter ATP-binding protein [Candidatus Peregrinibacteria bacterium]|nr:ABC transporter ATP-binding protein [Candidatus Peregrinibacteria bacterium]